MRLQRLYASFAFLSCALAAAIGYWAAVVIDSELGFFPALLACSAAFGAFVVTRLGWRERPLRALQAGFLVAGAFLGLLINDWLYRSYMLADTVSHLVSHH